MVAFAPSQPSILDMAMAPPSHADILRKQAMQFAWKAFRGEFIGPLKVKDGEPDDNVLPNRCEPIVNKGVSFLFGQSIKIEAPEGDEVIQAFLKAVWGDDDDTMTLLSDMGINGGVCGQSFVKIIPAKGDADFPRLVVQDPLLIRPVTDPDDCQEALAFVIEYKTFEDWQKRQIIARVDMSAVAEEMGPSATNTWTISTYLRKGNSGSWQRIGPIDTWPYPFPPLLSCKNLPNPNEFWGRPDLTEDMIKQNKALHLIESIMARIIKFHGHPRTWATGIRASQIEVGIDDVLCFESPDAKLNALAAMENFSGLLAVAENIRQNMDEQSRVPAIALGRLTQLPRGAISGVALKLLLQPLMEKTVQKQRLYGNLIRDISRAALVIGGLIPVEKYKNYPIKIQWQNLLPIDDLMAAQTAQILQGIGVSSDTLLAELGYDGNVEAVKVAKEGPKPKQAGGAAQLPAPGQGQPEGEPGASSGGVL